MGFLVGRFKWSVRSPMAKGCKHNNVKSPASKPHSARADGKLKRCNEAQTAKQDRQPAIIRMEKTGSR